VHQYKIETYNERARYIRIVTHSLTDAVVTQQVFAQSVATTWPLHEYYR